MAAVSCVEAVDLDPNPLVLSPLEAHTLKAPHPVLGADGRLHLAYELSLVNSSSLLVTVDKISVLLPGHDQAVIQVLQGGDGLPDNAPGTFPPNPTLQTAGGNHVVVDIGDGKFALYGHLRKGSVTQRGLTKGQRARSGQVLGLLGNSGNSDAPHLHFHVMDAPDPLNANGLPFEFTHFEGQGRGTAEGEAASSRGNQHRSIRAI